MFGCGIDLNGFEIFILIQLIYKIDLSSKNLDINIYPSKQLISELPHTHKTQNPIKEYIFWVRNYLTNQRIQILIQSTIVFVYLFWRKANILAPIIDIFLQLFITMREERELANLFIIWYILQKLYQSKITIFMSVFQIMIICFILNFEHTYSIINILGMFCIISILIYLLKTYSAFGIIFLIFILIGQSLNMWFLNNNMMSTNIILFNYELLSSLLAYSVFRPYQQLLIFPRLLKYLLFAIILNFILHIICFTCELTTMPYHHKNCTYIYIYI